jgi:hypothetical protein
MNLSSYISIFDDWDLLQPSLASVAPIVDEIVVVDGAYEWMTPYLDTVTRKASRSRDEVYDVLATFGKKIRVINGVWRHETHKRQMGYEACAGRYVLRNDADEVMFWDAARFADFVRAGQAVGQMEMPIYVAPGKIRAASATSPIERQSFLFDKQQMTSWQHLSYLWLVLPEFEQATLQAQNPDAIFAEPIAFTAHLTHWRSPATAVNRARFYVMNYVRGAGALPWLRYYNYKPETGFKGLFDIISPSEFDEILLGHDIVAGPPRFDGNVIRPSGRPESSDASFAGHYDDMLAALARLNDELLKTPRTIANGVQYMIDASTARSLTGVQHGGSIRLVFSEALTSAEVAISTLGADGKTVVANIPLAMSGRDLVFEVPEIAAGEIAMLRRTLVLTARFGPDTVYAKFRAANPA